MSGDNIPVYFAFLKRMSLIGKCITLRGEALRLEAIMKLPCFGMGLSVTVFAIFFIAGCGGGSQTYQPPPPPPPVADFAISVSPTSVSTQVGGATAPVTVTVTPTNGFSDSVSVSLDGFPNGITPSPSTLSLNPGMSGQVSFAAPAAAGTFAVNVRGTSGSLSHAAKVTLAVSPPATPFLVAATYFPWYTPDVFDYLECYGGSLRGELVPPQMPILGKYDSRQEDVITQHIAWSTAAGVNVWAMEWIGRDNFLDPTLKNTILINPHIGDMRFAIFYDFVIRFNGDLNITPAKIDAVISDFKYLASNYFSHPSYLKVDQGRPVVFMYATSAMAPFSGMQNMAMAIRQAIAAAGYSVFLIGDEYIAVTPPDHQRISTWDGIFGFNVYLGYAGFSDDTGYIAMHQQAHNAYAAVAQQLGVEFVSSLTPGFNDRAVRRTCADNPALARVTSAAAGEGSMYESFLRDVVLPTALNTRLKMVHIATFNEWHEDTQIEPSVATAVTTQDTSPSGTQYTQGLPYQGYGTTYMDILRDQIAAAQQRRKVD